MFYIYKIQLRIITMESDLSFFYRMFIHLEVIGNKKSCLFFQMYNNLNPILKMK